MGNCQAAEAATVVIQHPGPGGKVERMYWSITASEVMASNPGHYVAIVLSRPPNSLPSSTGPPSSTSSSSSSPSSAQPPQRHLKLLRPADTLQIGQVYRLISFEEVLKELATKKHVKLSRLLLTQQNKETGTTQADGCEPDARKKMKKKKKKEHKKTSGLSARRAAGSAAVAASTEPTPIATATVTQEAASGAQGRQQQQQHVDGEAATAAEVEEEQALVNGAGMGVMGLGGGMGLGMGRRYGGHWRPALQSIAECS